MELNIILQILLFEIKILQKKLRIKYLKKKSIMFFFMV